MRPGVMPVVILALLQAVAVSARERPSPRPADRTIGDLPPPAIEIDRNAPIDGDPERARRLYRQFLDQDAATPAMRAEATRRLADLALEAAEFERSADSGILAGGVNSREAIDLYGRLLEADPQYPRADAVLYQLARAWEAEGDSGRALEYLDHVVARYPQSRLIDEAQFRRGEILFSAGRWAPAGMAYAGVLAHGGSSRFHGQALYKIGWAQFKQARTEESVESFLDLLDLMLVDPRTPDRALEPASLARADRELVDDAFRAMSLQFVALDGAATASELIARHGPTPYEWLVHDRLGDLLIEKERYTDAADTYRAFAARRGSDIHAPGLQTKAIEAYRKGGFATLVLAAKQEYVEQYGFESAFWAGRDRGAVPDVVSALKSNLRDVAQHYHAVAQRSRHASDYAVAARWYRDYLRSFPGDPDSAATNHLLAEALFEARRFDEAVAEYERTAYDYPQHTRAAEAGYAALASLDRHAATLAGEERTLWHRREIDAGIRFATTFRQHAESPAVMLRASQQLYELKEYAAAADVATRLLALWPALPDASQRVAWNLIADAAFEQGRFAEAEAAYLRTQRLMTPDDGLAGAVTDRLAASVYRQGEARRDAGDLAGAVDELLRVSQLAPGSRISVTAQYDAGALLLRMKEWGRAIDVLESFRRAHPGHEFNAKIPRQLALAHTEAGRGREAAIEYRTIADDTRESAELRREALAEAARLFDAASAQEQAAEAYRVYVDRHPQPLDQAIAARLRLADMAGAAYAGGERIRWLVDVVAADAGAGAARTDYSRTRAAFASLELAALDRDRFAAVGLQAPLQKSLQAKRVALVQAVGAYQKAVDYGIAEVVNAATFETGRLYRRLASDLLKSERPKELDDEAREQYALLLEEQAFPFEEKAIELHVLNVARSRQGQFDRWIEASYQALAELKPARYARTETAFPIALAAGAADAVALAEQGRWRDAERVLHMAHEAAPADPAVLEALGLALRHGGRLADAEAAYRDALGLDPGRSSTLLNLAVLLDLFLDRPAEALPLYERYLSQQQVPDAKVMQWLKELRTRVPAGTALSGAAGGP